MTIAFKQAKDTQVKGQLPDTYIVEYKTVTDTSDPSWQYLPEADFQTLIALTNTQTNIDAFQAAKYQAFLIAQNQKLGL